MSAQSNARFLHETPAVPSRTALSAAFEGFWRALPKEGLVPNRSAFRPERAARFLRHIVLCEARLDGGPAIRMRLVGGDFEAQIQRSLKGHDYLQYLPEAYRQAAIESAREVVLRPCGLWQITPLHYERGYAQHVELTLFPLGPGPDGVNLLLVLTQSLGGLIMPAPTGDKAMAADTAVTHRYIDLGAGVPA
ncbi:MAG TPA: PAS domain-containing protein [Rhizomicrobium sp.]|nr:PAS domain-containing protein [Rhizomicrobium sp.]